LGRASKYAGEGRNAASFENLENESRHPGISDCDEHPDSAAVFKGAEYIIGSMDVSWTAQTDIAPLVLRFPQAIVREYRAVNTIVMTCCAIL